MNSERELIDAIRVDEGNLALKRAYAEWLESQGKPLLAEYLRLRDAEFPTDSRERDKQLNKVERLHDKVHKMFSAPLLELGAHDSSGWDVIRSIRVSVTSFLENGEALLAASPFHTVTFLRPGSIHTLAECSFLRPLRSIIFEGDNFTPKQFRSFIDSPHLVNLRNLTIWWRKDFTPECMRQLTQATLPPLRELILGATPLGAEGVAHLASWSELAHIDNLNLWNCRLGPEAATTFAASPFLGSLKSLDLGSNDLGDEGLIALSKASTLRGLLGLYLGSDHLGPDAIRVFANAPLLESVRSLSFGQNNLGSKGAIALASSPYLRNLKWLLLGSNKIGDTGVAALAASPIVAKLKTLHLNDNPIGEKGLAALVASTFLGDSLDLLRLSCGTSLRKSRAGKALKARFGDKIQW